MAQDCTSIDVEMGVNKQEPMGEQRTLEASKTSRRRQLGFAVLAIGLCAAAAVVFSSQNPRRYVTDGTQDLQLAVRDISAHHKGSKEAAIHLAGEYQSTTAELVWQDDVDQAFHQGGLMLVKNKISIPRTGLYYVYSQVSFRVNCQVTSESAEAEDVEQHLSHKVVRESKMFDQPRYLMESTRSSCERVVSEEDSGERWYSVINQGAVFKLERGDLLSTVTPSGLKYVEGDSSKTFFGVFAL